MKASTPSSTSARKGVLNKQMKAIVVPLFKDNPKAYMQNPVSWRRNNYSRGLANLIPESGKKIMPSEYNPNLVKKLELIHGLDFTPNDISAMSPPALEYIDLGKIRIEHNFQRLLSAADLGLMRRIISNWDWSKVHALVAWKLEDGFYYLTDGQKTALCALHRGDIQKLPCLTTHGTTMSESISRMAAAFVSLNVVKIPVPPTDIFTAAIVEGDKVSLQTQRILDKHGIHVRSMSRSASAQFGARETMIAGSIQELVRMRGPEHLDEILDIAANCNFRPIRRDHILAIQQILKMEKERNVKFSRPRLIAAINKTLDKYDLLEAKNISGRKSISRPKALAELYLARYKGMNEIQR